ncbi:nitrile hydratase accessory protein [Novosphingobium tardum]|uniref:Nitrile hydratase accessory protein n=1 Tax=Novosphingobium tardum TaxID=1538021 RepID=A0ABV8RMU7_9SPHN
MTDDRTRIPLQHPAADDLHFAAPWEASVFALTVRLSESGLFTWKQWVETFSKCLAEKADVPYYQVWLEALEHMVTDRNLITREELADRLKNIIDNPPPHDFVARREPIAIA